MKTLTRIGLASLLGLAIVGLVLVPLPAPQVHADAYGGYQANLIAKQEPAGRYQSAVNTDVAILVKYVGSQSGTVTVASNGDLTFKEGASGAEAASTSFECPVSGALGGIIDVSDSACDTLGEVVDTINGACTGCSSSNWRAVILDGLRSDSSNDTLAALSETASVTQATGLGLFWDSGVNFTSTIALTDCRDFTCGYVTTNIARAAPPMVENPWKGRRTVLWKDIVTSTYGSGTSAFSVIDVDVHNYAGSNGSETATTLWSQAGGSSTTALTVDWSTYGFMCKAQHKCLVRLTNTAAMTAVTHAVQAGVFPMN